MLNRAKQALAALVVVASFGAAFARGGEARVRFLHASPDAPAVDILVNGGTAVEGLKFGVATPYAAVPAGEYDVEVVPEGQTSPVVIDLTGPNAVNLFYHRSYTAVALGTLSSIEPLLLADDNRPAPRHSARIRFVHASPDAPEVDIAVAGGPVLFKNVAFKGVGDYVVVPAGTYDLEVRLAGTRNVVLSLPGVMVEGGTTYSVFATGFAFSTPSLAPVVTVDAVNPSITRGQGRGLDQ